MQHGWQLTASLLVVSGSDLQETMATRGRSSSSHTGGATQQFLQFAVRRKAAALVTAHSTFRESEAY
jgi:hypothetical protein